MADVLVHLLNFVDVADIDVLAAAERKLECNGKRFPVDAVRGRAVKAADVLLDRTTR